MNTIYKYPVGEIVSMPSTAKPLRVADQNGEIFVWVLLNTEDVHVAPRRFAVFGTGSKVPESATYIGSVTQSPFEWHIFEVV